MLNLNGMLKKFAASLIFILCIADCLQSFAITAYAKETSVAVKESIYEFASDAHYETSSSTASSGTPFGEFTISGDLKAIGDKNGVPAYSVRSENVNFFYSYKQTKLNAAGTEWHLIDDKTKKVDTISLDENILRGALIVQTSNNGTNWSIDATMTNIFTSESDLSDAFYTSKSIQLENGCYYRVIVAYELQRKVGEGKILFVTTEKTEEKKVAEVYEFYAVSSEIDGNTASAAATPRKELGQKIKTGKDNGYSGENEIDKNDPHYGWNLGTFVVNGYTRETTDNGTPVFLKNVGDKVTLWFTLAQDIDNLNGKSSLTIGEDTNGYDQFFEVPQTNFKRGTLIIRYTDYQGSASEPVVYHDFLAANATTGADTRVQLFEEGDYEVSLDYEIKNNPRQIGPVSVAPTRTNYKIAFNFSVRNGNCMVYPFDSKTGSELSNIAVTSDGFKLDMAKSRYLTIDVKQTALNLGADGLLTEDVRFNRPAKDNDIYTDDGIYTFTVKNLYTGENTTKTIYVGTSKYLLALSKNNLTVSDLNEKIAQNATIDDDGTINEYVPEPEPEPEPEVEPEPDPEPEPAAASPTPTEPEPRPAIAADTAMESKPMEPLPDSPSEESQAWEPGETSQRNTKVLFIAAALLAVLIIVTIWVIIKKNKKR